MNVTIKKTILIILAVVLVAELGLAVLLGVIGSYFWHPLYLLTAFVGAGLVFAGLTGFCGLAVLLAKMPWNKDCGGNCPLKP